MVRRLSIAFREVHSQITEPVTKFGGQPVWITERAWPVSRRTDKQMMFICQIELRPDLFGNIPGKMAYVFMADDEDWWATNDPNAGENAVIIQPGSCRIKTLPLSTGPSLYTMLDVGGPRLVPMHREYAVEFAAGEDPDLIDGQSRLDLRDEAWSAYVGAVSGNKVGGTPFFLQYDQFPGPGNWQLLLQLDSFSVPFDIDFGDGGIGYVFLSDDGTVGKFLWQCS